MSFTLPDLPFEKNALEPHISAETIEFHYGKHHQAYVTNLNNLTEGKPEAEMSLEKVILGAEPGGLLNNAAQVWNHTFYWNCLSGKSDGAPSGELADAINEAFGSFEEFKKQLAQAAVTQFGSGWAWLVWENSNLKITQTANADTPIRHNQTPLLTIDVWEHAYYVDYRNARPKYVDMVIENLINWNFVAENFSNPDK